MNIPFIPKEYEEMAAKWKQANKPSKIVGSFTDILQLNETHLKHFRNAPYIWKPMNGSIYAGMLMDDNLDYIHLVLVSKEVLEYVLKL